MTEYKNKLNEIDPHIKEPHVQCSFIESVKSVNDEKQLDAFINNALRTLHNDLEFISNHVYNKTKPDMLEKLDWDISYFSVLQGKFHQPDRADLSPMDKQIINEQIASCKIFAKGRALGAIFYKTLVTSNKTGKSTYSQDEFFSLIAGLTSMISRMSFEEMEHSTTITSIPEETHVESQMQIALLNQIAAAIGALTSQFEQDWTAKLSAAMRPLTNPQSNPIQKPLD